MNERETEVLKQYNLCVKRLTRSRGAFLCETAEGLFLLKETSASAERLEWENHILEGLRRRRLHTEQYVRNREGELLARSADYHFYYLRAWRGGRECDRDSAEDLTAAVRGLGRLHRGFAAIRDELAGWEEKQKEIFVSEQKRMAEEAEARAQEEGTEYFAERERPARPPVEYLGHRAPGTCTAERMKKHNREMARVKNYVKKLRRRSEFENLVASMIGEELERGERAAEEMERLALPEDGLMHGDYACHHLYFEPGGLRVTDFSSLRHGTPLEDLYAFSRKCIEKRHWDAAFAGDIFRAYEEERPLAEEERRYLYLRFAYPEKFWKQVNFYLNHRKAWVPARNLEKLRELSGQKKEKEKFLFLAEKF